MKNNISTRRQKLLNTLMSEPVSGVKGHESSIALQPVCYLQQCYERATVRVIERLNQVSSGSDNRQFV